MVGFAFDFETNNFQMSFRDPRHRWGRFIKEPGDNSTIKITALALKKFATLRVA
jgi:hypothetical protein